MRKLLAVSFISVGIGFGCSDPGGTKSFEPDADPSDFGKQSTLVPDDGFEPVQKDAASDLDSDGSAVDCEGLDESSCTSQPGCAAIVGTPVFVDLACVGAEQFIACDHEDSLICGDGIAGGVVDREDRCWYQMAVCIPSDWTQATEENGNKFCADAGGLPQCEG